MALFDSIISEVAGKFGLGDKAGPLVSALFSLISSSESGGITGFLDKFKNAGLGNLVSSWISTGASEPLTTNQLESALGSSVLSGLANKVGLPLDKVSPALAFLIPSVVDKLTPSGVVPSSLPSIGSLLSGVTGLVGDAVSGVAGAATGAAGAAAGAVGAAAGAAGAAASAATGAVGNALGAGANLAGNALGAGANLAGSAAHAATDAASSAGGGLLKLLPLLLLALLAFLGYQYCNRPTGETHTATTAAPTATPAPKINSSLSLINADGKVKVTGVVPDEATKAKILAELKATYGEGKFEADIKVDPNAQPAGWFAKLTDIFKSFNIPGAELSFDGDSIKVAGAAAAVALVDKLKGLFPTGFNISSAFLNVADAVKAANEKAAAALASLTGSNAEDLVKALNLQIINFASGKADLPKENQDILKKAAEAIKAMPAGTKIEVGGHTDNKGAAAGNLKLSEARANAVAKFLTGLGVSADHLSAKGYGPDKPVATNDTDEGRFKNRRIEFSIAK